MGNRVILGVAWAGSLALAVVLARRPEARSPSPTPLPVPAGRAAPPALPRAAPMVAATETVGPDLDALRAVVREELAARERDRPEPGPTRDADRTPAPPAVHAEAHAMVSEALDAGRWTDARRDALRQRMSALSREQLDEVLSPLFVAINEGRLQVETTGPLL